MVSHIHPLIHIKEDTRLKQVKKQSEKRTHTYALAATVLKPELTYRIVDLEKKQLKRLKHQFDTSKNLHDLTTKTHKLHQKYLSELQKIVGKGAKNLNMEARKQYFFDRGHSGFHQKNHTLSFENGMSAESIITPKTHLKNTLMPTFERNISSPERKKTPTGVANLQESVYKIGKEVTFQGLRSGVITTHPQAKELLTLSFVRFLQKPENKHLLEDIKAGKPLPPIPFQHTSMSLLALIGSQKKMFKREYAALKKLEGEQTFTLEIDGKKIDVKANVKVDCFNMACSPWNYSNFCNTHIHSFRSLAFKVTGFVCQKILSLGGQHRYNDTAFENMHERVQELEKTDTPKARLARSLYDQIKNIGGPNGYTKKTVSNPVAVQARILLLSHLLGDSVHWHCKSGKDRTGMLDIEVKYLVQWIASSKTVPPLNVQEETRAMRLVRQEIALEGGNTLVAWENTAEFGLKYIDGSQYGNILGKRVAHLIQADSPLAKD